MSTTYPSNRPPLAYLLFALIPVLVTNPLIAASTSPSAARVASGLQVQYDFRGSGGKVEDRVRSNQRLHLQIIKPNSLTRREGSIETAGKSLIRSAKPATRLVEIIRYAEEVSVELWLQPEKTSRQDAMNVFSLSDKNGNTHNLRVFQEEDRFLVELMTDNKSKGRYPKISTTPGSVTNNLIHFVFTHDRTGRARIYLNGELNVEKHVVGSFNQWSKNRFVMLGGTKRAWSGSYHLAAIYSRDLLPREVRSHFEFGPSLEKMAGEQPRDALLLKNQTMFDRHVAPLLVKRCFECHDTNTKKGGLDLSRKDAAAAGGESGPTWVAGKVDESLLWQYIESDEMPVDREPLTKTEKSRLRDWIEAGAAWSVDVIDPLVYEGVGEDTDFWIRRLTVDEYINTVRSAVGVDIEEEARRLLPPDVRADGFNNTAYNLTVDMQHVESFSRLAEMIVQRMDVMEFAGQFTEHTSLSTDDTMRDDVAKVGKWLFRGPLTNREITNYSGIATLIASAGGDFEEAISTIVEAMLQSPRFLYRVENQSGDGTVWPAGAYELASRLSYTLWGGPPDRELMRAADSGALFERIEVAAQVSRMLDDPRALGRSKQFIFQWLDLGRLNNMRPNAERFPTWNAELAEDMQQETLAFFEHVVWHEQRPLAELINAQVTFATPRLAKHYGLEVRDDKLAQYDLSEIPRRGGLLTQGSILTIGGDEASMVSRGLFVLHELLRGSVKDPPPNVDTNAPPTKEGLTQRGISESRIANTNCGGCHKKFEPLAFGLEKFDGIGAFHENDEHGNKLRDDGAILFPGTTEPIPYKNSAELMDLLAKSERVGESFTWKLTQFALGRQLGPQDAPTVRQIHNTARKQGGTYKQLMTAIVMSDLIQMTPTEKVE